MTDPLATWYPEIFWTFAAFQTLTNLYLVWCIAHHNRRLEKLEK